jgi:tetratricopeptide (TPR) repeat protein
MIGLADIEVAHWRWSPINRIKAVCLLLLGGLVLSGSLVPEAAAQDTQPSRREKLVHYSLYYENFKNKNYESARSDLLWILEHAPGLPKGDARNYRRAVELYEGLAKRAASKKKRKAYLDTAATYLATAPKKMKRQGIEYAPYAWELRKGRFMERHQQQSFSEVKGLKTSIAHYRNAFELAPEEVDPYYIQRVLQAYLRENELQKALEFARIVEKKRGYDKDVAKIVSRVREQVFGKNPQAQIAYLERQAEAHPDSTRLLTELFNAYAERGNVRKASRIAERLMKAEPPAGTVRKIAQMRLENGRPKAAVKAYNRAIKQEAQLKAQDYFNLGTAYQKIGKLPKAREMYRKAIKRKEDFGRAYIVIGDLYVQAVNQCSGGEIGRTDRAVYWAAVDKYRKAKQVDPSVAARTNRKIETYRKVFPTKEDIFYRSAWKTGASLTIDDGCYSWIEETTTVRPAPSSG